MDKSPFGILDMAGNIPEWTSTLFSGPVTPSGNIPNNTTSDRKTFRGVYILKSGNWPISVGLSQHRCARGFPLSGHIGDKTGMRIAKDIPHQYTDQPMMK